MRVPRHRVVDLEGIIFLYLPTFVAVLLVLSEAIKTITEGEAGHVWAGVILYAYILSLAILMPIFYFRKAKDMGDDCETERCMIVTVVSAFFTLLSCFLFAHAITTVSATGLNLIQFQDAIYAMLDTENPAPTWYKFGYVAAMLGYATVVITLHVGIVGCALISVMKGWKLLLTLADNSANTR